MSTLFSIRHGMTAGNQLEIFRLLSLDAFREHFYPTAFVGGRSGCVTLSLPCWFCFLFLLLGFDLFFCVQHDEACGLSGADGKSALITSLE